MSIKTLLSVFNGEVNELGALRTAFALARQHSGALRILHIAEPPIFYQSLIHFGEVPLVGVAKVEVLEKTARDLTDAAQARATEIARDQGFALHFEGSADMAALQAQFRTAIGTARDCLPQEGRTVDLIAMPYDNSPSGDLAPLLTALFRTGRPVLAIPRNPGRNFATGRFPNTVVVAWDGSLAAGRAVRDAMPLLQQADSVYIICADEGSQTSGVTGEADFMAYLHSHAVAPEFLKLPTDTHGAGATLLAQSKRFGANLIVMGAYGTSHVGEMILGGVSNHMIKHTSVPLLLSH